jgi:hypothetical protein
MLLSLAGVGALCQTPGSHDARECAQAANRLRSEFLREKSWGAHLAAACQMPWLAGEIVAELERLHPETLAKLRWDSELYWLGRSMLDALIQLRQPLPSSVLASIAEGFPVEGTILTLPNAFENRLLLAAVRARPGGGEWVAAGNALARVRAPGFAAALLAEIRLTHSVWVSDNGVAPGRGEAGSLASGSPTLRVPPGFPPVGVYRLTAQPAPDDELVSDGAVPIYSQRAIIEPGVDRTLAWLPEGYCSRCLEIGYLAELAHVSNSDVSLAVEPQTAVKWTDPMRLDAEISRSLAAQQAAVRQLAGSLVSAGVLETRELGMALHIDVLVEDQRSDRSVPLPKYPPVEFRLR